MSKGLKHRRSILWHEDPHCYWCGVLTELPTPTGNSPHCKTITDNTATVDHIDSRLSGRRGHGPRGGEERTVLACNKCNQARCRDEEAALQKVELWWRSGRRPRDNGHVHACGLFAEHVGLCRCDCGATEVGPNAWYVPARHGCADRHAPTMINNGRPAFAMLSPNDKETR